MNRAELDAIKKDGMIAGAGGSMIAKALIIEVERLWEQQDRVLEYLHERKADLSAILNRETRK
jgi:hypothetical protein